MTIGTLIYLLIVLAGFLISVFCLQYGTVAVVGALLVIPFFMIFFLILLACISAPKWNVKIR